MKPEGIRKVIAEQSWEGAIIFLFDLIQDVIHRIEGNGPVSFEQPAEPPKDEVA